MLRQWLDGGFEAITCGALVGEVGKVLARPYMTRRITADERAGVIDFLINHSRFVPDVAAARVVAADPKDDYLVAIAREYAAALVTGDRHLLDLPAMPAVMTPARFLQVLGATG